MTRLNLSVDDVLTTTRAVRKRLDFDRPVPYELVRECLELAVQSPTGSVGQFWHFVLVDDADKPLVSFVDHVLLFLERLSFKGLEWQACGFHGAGSNHLNFNAEFFHQVLNADMNGENTD